MNGVTGSLPSSKANNPILEKWGCTEIKVHEFSYTWTIKNFSFCREGINGKITSPVFYIGDNDKIEGSLILYPDGYGEGAPDHLSLFLKLVSCKEPKRDVIRARMEVCILKMDTIESYSMSPKIETFSFKNNEYIHGFSKLIEKKLLTNGNDLLLPNDELTLLCKGSAATEIVRNSGEFKSIHSIIPDCHVLDNLESFFDNENLSDVLFVVNGHEFRAHKVILAAQSPIFTAMFNHRMTTRQQNRIDINDIEPDVFSEMLKFMYTGEAPNLKKMPIGLLSASDKYNISRLKAMCEDTLASSIKTENVLDMLILANVHDTDKLKREAIKFFAQNITNVRNTTNFKSMIRSHPQLLEEVLVYFH